MKKKTLEELLRQFETSIKACSEDAEVLVKNFQLDLLDFLSSSKHSDVVNISVILSALSEMCGRMLATFVEAKGSPLLMSTILSAHKLLSDSILENAFQFILSNEIKKEKSKDTTQPHTPGNPL